MLAPLAGELGRGFDRARAQDIRLYGFAEHILTTTVLGSSSGLRRRAVQPTGRFDINAKSDRGGSAWAGRSTRDFTDVDVGSMLDDLQTRLGWGETSIALPPGRYETLLPPAAVADLMIYAFWTANAQDAEEGRNVYAVPGGGTTIGRRLSELPITLTSDPAYPGLECAPFVDSPASADGTNWAFDMGLPVTAVDWLSGGVHSELIRNRARASKTGLAVTAPPDNLIMEAHGTATMAEMIARTERGLLLTCLWYIREVDPERLLLTGLTRDGVYLIENGVVVGCSEQLPVQRISHRDARTDQRDRAHREGALPGVERLLQPNRHAPHPSARLQHVDGEPGELAHDRTGEVLATIKPWN